MTDIPYERSYYSFERATLESGYVEITDQNVCIFFPALDQALSTVPKEVNLFLQEILILSFKWLPFYSSSDYIKIMDMFYKCLFSFGPTYAPYTASPYRVFNKLVTNTQVKNFNIYTFEENRNVSIQITHQNNPLDIEPPDIDQMFQIYIGPNLIFCNKRDLLGLDKRDQIFVIQLILYKFTDF